jgi:hypothetical protein
MFASIIQLALLACMIPLLLLSQDLQLARRQQQVALLARTLLAQHQALQQFCAVRPDPPAPPAAPAACATPGAIARTTLRHYLDPALATSPYLTAVHSLFDGRLRVSYLDPNQTASLKSGQLTGQLDAAWMRVSTGSVCAGLYRHGLLRCADGSALTIDGAAWSIPDGAPMIADP